MKRILALTLCMLIMCLTAACSAGDTPAPDEASQENTTALAVTDEIKQKMDQTLEGCGYKGIVYITQGGVPIYESYSGSDVDGEPLTAETSMCIGSTSKQFCAAAVMLLRDRGMLSVDDTLDRYFPDYAYGSGITVKNLLTMRSGIPNLWNGLDLSSLGENEEENVAKVLEWALSEEPGFEPDGSFEYSNTNYFLLALIVEQVTGQSYREFMHENIFGPLNMTHTGFLEEVSEGAGWVKGLHPNPIADDTGAPGLSKGAGDIVSTALDMDLWMTALTDGTLFSPETLAEMTQDYSPDDGKHYGCGLMGLYHGGFGHPGTIGSYNAIDYFNKEYDLHLYAASNKSSAQTVIENLPSAMLKYLIKDE